METTLIKLYFRRYLSEGKVYVIIGLVLPILLLVIFTFSGSLGKNEASRTAVKQLAAAMGLSNPDLYLVAVLYPFIMPVFAIVGSVMAPALYSEDKSNGFYEFVMSSTKIGTKDIFWSIVLTGLAMVLIVIAVIFSITVILFIALNGSVPLFFIRELAIYSVPVAIVASLIVSSVSFLSEAMTKKISFVNSPAGVAPIFGIAIAVIPMVFFETSLSGPVNLNQLLEVLAVYVSGAFVAFILLFLVVTRRMVRERFLP